MEEEKTRKGSSSNKSENKEIDKKIEVSNTVELDIINEDEEKLKKEDQKPANDNEIKMNINPTKNKKLKKNKKIKISKQMVGIIVIAILCIVITICLTILKIREINSKYKVPEEENAFVSENKKPDDELKYVVGENDTLDYNEIEYKSIFNIDGNEFLVNSDERYGELYSKYQDNYSVWYDYIQISGLKDKNVENKINEQIKSCVISIEDKDEKGRIHASTNIMGNFNNILSISVGYYEGKSDYKYKGINFDLNTGNIFQLEDVFTKSTSIINILYNSLCEALAWDTGLDAFNYNNYEEYWKKYEELSNMDNRDTSHYEDMIFKLSNWYKSNKGNVNFFFNGSRVYISDVIIDGNNYSLTIPLYNYKDNVAIYKRYKSGVNIFEEQDKYIEGVVPFTSPMAGYGLKDNQVAYGKKTSNLFVDISFLGASELDKKQDVKNKIREMMKVYANNTINEEIKKANSNKQNGYVLQSFVNICDNTSEASTQYYNNEIGGYKIPHYSGSIENYGVELSIKEFEKLNEYLAKAELFPKSSMEQQTLKYYLTVDKSEIYKNRSNTKVYYFDVNGNYLGDDIQVIKDTTREVYQPS